MMLAVIFASIRQFGAFFILLPGHEIFDEILRQTFPSESSRRHATNTENTHVQTRASANVCAVFP